MTHSFGELPGSYSTLLVVVSVLLSTLAAFTAVELASRVTETVGMVRTVWLAGGACAMGIGIWSMHYVGMLAFQLPVDVFYHLPTVLLSLCAAILASWIALSSVSRPNLSYTRIVMAGIVMGGGVATMHYVGMAAMRLQADCHYNVPVMTVSLVLAVVISTVAIILIFRLRRGHATNSYLKAAGVLLMGLAIPVMHYTGMAAAHFSRTYAKPDLGMSVGVNTLGISAIVTASVLVLVMTVGLAVVDRQLAAKGNLLEATERRHRHLVESVQALIWQRSVASNRFTLINQHAEEVLGFPVSAWLADENFLEDHAHPEDRQVVLFYCRQATQGSKPVEFEARFITGEGSIVYLRTYLQVNRSPSGELELTGVAHDVSATRLLRNELIEQRRYFETLMNSTPDYIYFKNLKSCFVQINRSMAVSLFHLNSPEEAIGLSDRAFFGDEHSRAALEAEQGIIETGEPIIDLEEREDWQDGHVTWVSTTKMPLFNVDGEIIGTFGISRNITQRKLDEIALLEKTEALTALNESLKQEMDERRNLEGQLLHAQKLESIGQLAAGVAHEINTPVQYVSDNCRFLSDSFSTLSNVMQSYNQLLQEAKAAGQSPELVESIEETVQAADLQFLSTEIPSAIGQSLDGLDRVAQIVRSMKEFSHPGSAEKAPADLNRAIENTLLVCRNEYKYVAQLVTELDSSLPPVYCFAGEINQVVLNLVVNAAHAITGSGKSLESGQIRVSTKRRANQIEIRVADNGSGIPEAIRNKVFDPFFTTKEVGKGSGQGLALARNVIVKKHGGTLQFESQEGVGTTFIACFPIGCADPV